MVPDYRPSRPSHVFVIDSPKRRLRWLWWVGGALAVLSAFAGYYWFGPLQKTLPAWEEVDEAAVAPAGPGEAVAETPTVPEVTAQEVQDVAGARTETPEPPSAPVRRTNPRPPVTAQPVAPAPVVTPAPEIPQVPGQLFINSRPWGRVYIDGEFVGNTPQAGLTIAAGVHSLRVVRDGFEPYEAEIEIFSGRQRRITDIVLRPRQP